MSDLRARQLQRQATADPSLEASVLSARVRTGALAAKRLELAAYLGYGPALVALGLRESPTVGTLHSHVRSLVRWGRRPLLLAVTAVARQAQADPRSRLSSALFPPWGYDVLVHERRLLARALVCVDDYLACPCARHVRDCEAQGQHLIGAPRLMCLAVSARKRTKSGSLGGKAVRYLYPSQGGLTHPRLRRVVREAVVPWALAAE